jgi:hypothetical protein
MSEVNPAVTGAWLESHDPGDRQRLKNNKPKVRKEKNKNKEHKYPE